MKTEIPPLTDQDELLTGYITCTRKRMGYQTLHIRHAGNDIGWWPWCLKDFEPQDLKYLIDKFQQFGRELYVPARDFNPCWPKHLPAILTSSEHTTAALQLDLIFILLKKLKQTNFCWQQDCKMKAKLIGGNDTDSWRSVQMYVFSCSSRPTFWSHCSKYPTELSKWFKHLWFLEFSSLIWRHFNFNFFFVGVEDISISVVNTIAR